ncbi:MULTISPECIES: cation diffusion facilitator family transporter [unclassified Uliginosibacterium]|uniref:cation diffusion facilitator family transporter n=1 Tax=unclassified Uliginosibacterium TaxID=2621521 RepID=UPI000C7C2C5C|nr:MULTISPECIES: cation diffusion facilitator family transporter [unclassified Uliginosibacterium]MDO6386776.1 cation diffusion facilitator family transporter [Uliginosibacterium sp. 31-12]PLK50593.1 cation transporter [Uliginosibacterium sp. TH139]
MSRKKNVALLSVASNTLLIVLKLAAGVLSGSVSIISEAIHSMMDLVAAVIAFFAVRLADVPPDEDHPYGHEKFENVSGVIEGVLIVVAALWIIIEAVHKLGSPEPMQAVGWGVAVMFVSALVNTLVAHQLYKVAREEQSMALEADALHLKADVYTSLGVGFGLAAIWATGWHQLDPLVAIAVALFILKEAVELIAKAFAPLIDASLPKEEIEAIHAALSRHAQDFIDYHELRTRQSGKIRHVDLHVRLHRHTTLENVHVLCDRLESEIVRSVEHAKVLIHADPCKPGCACSDQAFLRPISSTPAMTSVAPTS